MTALTTDEVARLAGVTRRVVSGLVALGLVIPLARGAKGRGHSALFDHDMAVDIATAAVLKRGGLPWETALAAVRPKPGVASVVSPLTVEAARRRVLQREAVLT